MTTPAIQDHGPVWPIEPASGRGRSHGTSSSEPFDRWFRYPAGFASDYVALLLDRLKLERGAVVDCFAGSGVTGTAARGRGLDFIGLEAHPLVGELADLKLNPRASASGVRSLCKKVVAEAEQLRIGERSGRPESEPELIRRSFGDATLRDLIALRQAVRSHLDEPAGLYLKWALLATLRDVAGVKVGWPYQRPAVARTPRHTDSIGRFQRRVANMAEDLDGVAGSRASAQILIGDSQDPKVWRQVKIRAAACVASPPYLNNFDYADATRLELYFWGEVTTWADMCREVRADMLTATTQQASVHEKAVAVAALRARGDAVGTEILDLVEAIGDAQRARGGRAKEYDRVMPAYFAAMASILKNLHSALVPGATALWLVGDSAPYGVYVDTPGLIGKLAAEAGFDFDEDVQLRVRGNRWGSNSDRHKVPLAERLIVLRKPA